MSKTTTEPKYFIGSRLSFTEMETVIGRPVSRAGRPQSLQAAALSLGINRTKKGRKIHFYILTESEVETFVNPVMETFIGIKGLEWRPLVKVAYSDRDKAWEEVCKVYPDRMTPHEYRFFTADQTVEIMKYMTVIQEDKPIQRAARERVRTVSNPGLKVGMKTPAYAFNERECGVVVRTTDKSFWIENDEDHEQTRYLFRGNEDLIRMIINQNAV